MNFRLFFESAAKVKYNPSTGTLDGVPPGHAVRLTKLATMYRGEELAKIVPQRLTHIFALHPENWMYTFHSLTGKDWRKIGFYGPEVVPIKHGTLIGEMSYATAFMYGGSPLDAEKYVASLKPLEQADIRSYEKPELLIPR